LVVLERACTLVSVILEKDGFLDFLQQVFKLRTNQIH